jgi:Ca-activated chloride channel homolog
VPKGDKVGLVTFSDNFQVISPPTTDRAAVGSALGVLTPEGGTALGSAIEASLRMIVASLSATGVHHPAGAYLPAAIVLESDGRQDRGTISPSAAAAAAKAAGVRIYGVALGTRHGYITQGSGLLTHSIRALPDPGTIALLARETGGEAFSARSAGALDTIYRHLGSSIVRRRKPIEITSWFELAAAVLLVAGVAAARRRGGALP